MASQGRRAKDKELLAECLASGRRHTDYATTRASRPRFFGSSLNSGKHGREIGRSWIRENSALCRRASEFLRIQLQPRAADHV
jgi:hypothetical protein